MVENSEYIVGVEMLLAAQGLTMTEALMAGFALGRGTGAAYREIRRQVPACLDGDRWYHDDIAIARSFVQSGSVRAAVESEIGRFL